MSDDEKIKQPRKFVAADEEYDETGNMTYITLCMLTGRSQEQMDRIEAKLATQEQFNFLVAALRQIKEMPFGLAGTSASNVAWQALKKVGAEE